MLIKEYRIPMPLSVEEYRIAQLYMIQKKSREESQGTESGVEIIVNKPYIDGPGGDGQYTHKIYHIGKHIPGWLVSLLPKDALIAEEEAWNAYPYTRTRYTCPFVEKFSIDIETRYLNDAGETKNIFDLPHSELRNTTIDVIDIVKENASDYKKEEDPKLFKSIKTGQGPLNEDWLEKMKNTDPSVRGKVMCAYKRCKVEFKYWGMQSKIEKFIHDIALRKVMLRAHKQAWCWQDEWHGLTMDDIRKLEKETQLALQLKFGANASVEDPASDSETIIQDIEIDLGMSVSRRKSKTSLDIPSRNQSSPSQQSSSYKKRLVREASSTSLLSNRSKFSLRRKSSQMNFNDGKIEGIQRYSTDTESDDDDEFFDARDELPQDEPNDADLHPLSHRMSSSLENLADPAHFGGYGEDKVKENKHIDKQLSIESFIYDHDQSGMPASCKIDYLFLVLHGGNALESSHQDVQSYKQSDLTTLQTTMEGVINSHYKAAAGRIAMRLVACPVVCNQAYQLLQNLSPSGHDSSIRDGSMLPSALISLFATSSSTYHETISSLTVSCNLVYNSFLDSPEGRGFNGQVCIISDTIGSVLGYDMLCKCPFKSTSSLESRRGSNLSNHERSSSYSGTNNVYQHLPTRQMSQFDGPLPYSMANLDFEVMEFFMLGSPLGLILAMRQLTSGNDGIMNSNAGMSQLTPPKPACRQIYNLFYTSDPSSARLEPLLDMRFSSFPPATVAKYQMFPLGDGQSLSIGDLLAASTEAFSDDRQRTRRGSQWSIGSGAMDQQLSGHIYNKAVTHDSTVNVSDDHVFQSTLDSAAELHKEVACRWWGEKRIDFALFHPEALSKFPPSTLPHLFHSSFWESSDVAAFMLRQIVVHDHVHVRLHNGKNESFFKPSAPREKWQRKRTNVKLRNVTANHRARDSIALENQSQTVIARFLYGPLDVVALTGEKVDIHVKTPPPSSEWIHVTTEVTNGHGKITCNISDHKQLGLGIYPIKMVVRGDHTSADSYLAVLPPNTDCVIFSIDGSFTASVSIMGSDPKVRPGAVDVVRLWQDLGYLILYVTARPDMQKQRVVTWLAQHNFPHGLIWFGDGLSHDPLKQKALLLRNMKANYKLNYAAGYGSSKDIGLYSQLGIEPQRIFIVGKTSKKQNQQCTPLASGYSSHQAHILANELVAAAKYNSQIVLQKGCFSLPSQVQSPKAHSTGIKKKKSIIKKQSSHEN